MKGVRRKAKCGREVCGDKAPQRYGGDELPEGERSEEIPEGVLSEEVKPREHLCYACKLLPARAATGLR